MKTMFLIVYCMMISIICLSACKDDELSSEEGAKKVVEDLSPTLQKIFETGLTVKDDTSGGATIDPISESGDHSGEMIMGGTIAQQGGNDQLVLWIELDNYSDSGEITYQTDNTDDATKLQMNGHVYVANQDNIMDGDLDGELTVGGSVSGTATFDLHFVSDLEDDDINPALICTRVTGTITMPDSEQSIDMVIPEDLSTLDETQQEKCTTLTSG